MADWRLTTWGAVSTLEYGRALRGYHGRGGAVRVYGTNGPVGWTDTALSGGPGVIVGRKGAYRGVHYSAEPFWAIDTAFYLRTAPGIDLRWAYYALRHAGIGALDAGSAIPSTSRHDLYALPLLLPPEAEQRRTAAVLGALDDKIAANGRVAARLDDLSLALHAATFAGARTTRGTLADLCDTQYGYTASAVRTPVGPRLLRVKDINKRNWITWPEVPYCAIAGGDLDRYRLRRGDLVVARMADPGKSAIVEDDEQAAVFASYLVRLTTADLAAAYFVWGHLKSAAYREYADAVKSGSVQPTMNARMIVGAPVGIPPAARMRRYRTAVEPLRRELHATLRQTARLAALRDDLLPRLLAGNLKFA